MDLERKRSINPSFRKMLSHNNNEKSHSTKIFHGKNCRTRHSITECSCIWQDITQLSETKSIPEHVQVTNQRKAVGQLQKGKSVISNQPCQVIEALSGHDTNAMSCRQCDISPIEVQGARRQKLTFHVVKTNQTGLLRSDLVTRFKLNQNNHDGQRI